MLQVDRLSIHFADREEVQEVVRGISFSVQDGEIVGIVGESGSGKAAGAGEPDRYDFSGADDRLESDDEDRKTGGGGAASAYGSG